MSCDAAKRRRTGEWALRSRHPGFPVELPNLSVSHGTQLSRQLAPCLAGKASLGAGPRYYWGWQDSTARLGRQGHSSEHQRASHPESLGKRSTVPPQRSLQKRQAAGSPVWVT
jgi:hypothetical protein